ncbi:MAG: DUF4258 domain-containing protein [Gammaproteobacteria bacterium]
MDFELTEHARESLRKRPTIRMTWVEQVLRNPELANPDDIDPDLEHRLGRIDECEGRVLRVIVNRAVSPLRIVTVYFDRAMRNKL